MRIETERLVLRRLAESDLDAFLELHTAPEVVRFFGAYGREQATERLRMDARQWRARGYGLFAVLAPGTGRFLGRVGLRYRSERDEVDVGWVLRPEEWGRGLATEAAGACLRWGFQTFGLRYVVALIEPENTRSVRVAQRLGMRPLRREVAFARDMVVHSVSAPHAGTGVTAAGSTGSETTRLVPCPGSDSTEIVPPLPSMKPLAMASPSPEPVSTRTRAARRAGRRRSARPPAR